MLFYASLSPKIASDLHVARLDEAEPAHQKVDEKCNDGRGGKMTAEEFVDEVFGRASDTLMVAIFDAEEMDSHWGVGKMSDYVIQKYWLTKDDVLEDDGKTYKRLSFPPHEGMKDIKMEPAYGTFPPTK